MVTKTCNTISSSIDLGYIMSSTVLKLSPYPYNGQIYSIELKEENQSYSSIEDIIERSKETAIIYSDLSYVFYLETEELNRIKNVEIYINDIFEPSTFNSDNGKIKFSSLGLSEKRIFQDCFGFVEISVLLTFVDETTKNLVTDYLQVVIKNNSFNESVRSMVDYIYDRQDVLLFHDNPQPRDLASLRDKGKKIFESQIILAEEIANLYESSFGFFKANSRFRIEKDPVVDHVSKLQQILPDTLKYMISHPEQLKPINSTTGIRVRKKNYQPQKTLLTQNKHSLDIYENRIIISFLRYMVNCVAELHNKCQTLLEKIPENENYNSEYKYSSFIIFSETRKTLIHFLEKLDFLQEKYSQLFGAYQRVFEFMPEPFTKGPKPTAVFLGVPQYKKIFVGIYQWMNYGIYDLSDQKFMLSFAKISSLYEIYFLLKLIDYFEDRNYHVSEAQRFYYPVNNRSSYSNTSYNNTFVLNNNNNKLTIYYQPVIFSSSKRGSNSIELYKNNSIPADTAKTETAEYYNPDFIIKIENPKINNYIVIDAKFSSFDTVKKYYFQNLSFKYLFSFSTLSKNANLSGLCAVYAKCSSGETIKNMYDKQINELPIKPYAETLPLLENIDNDAQYDKLDSIFNKFISPN